VKPGLLASALSLFLSGIMLQPLAAQSSDPAAMYETVQKMIKRGDCREAVSLLNDIMALTPKDALLYNERAFCRWQMGRQDDAMDDWDAAIRLDSKLLIARSSLGYAYMERGRLDRAIEAFNGVMALDPRYMNARIGRAIAFSKSGSLEAALGDYTIAIKQEPETPRIYFNRAVTYERLNKMDEALADYSRAIELDPADLKSLLRRAELHEQRKNWDAAIADAQKALDIDPQNVQAGVMVETLPLQKKAESAFAIMEARRNAPAAAPATEPKALLPKQPKGGHATGDGF
jgi:tetratricopeptide (TPR) repeat protein